MQLPRGVYKCEPGDFVVQEVAYDADGRPEAVPIAEETEVKGWDHRSPVTIFELTKSGWSTEDALREVARQFRTSFSCVTCSGLKDKQAITSQKIAVVGNFRPRFASNRIKLQQLWGAYRLRPHLANRFSIFIRTEAESINLEAAREFPNYFGPQRLGGTGTEHIGRLLFEGRPTEAADITMQSPGRRKLEAARALAGTSLAEALFHPTYRFSLRFELQKWQSYLWNQLLEQLIQECGIGQLPSTLPTWSADPCVAQIYRDFWEPEQSPSAMEWAMRLAPSFKRTTVIAPSALSAERKPKGWEVNFDLPPGCYATVMLGQVFELEEQRLQ